MALGVAHGLGPEAPEPAERLFRADLAALTVAAAAGAFLGGDWRHALLRLPAMALLAGAAHGVVGGEGAGALALLVLAAGLSTSGLAAVGRRVGAPPAAAAGIAAAVLWAAMGGLFWADPVAEAVPPARRFALRQAVLHVDLATAAAYGAARFDRFHEPRIYHDVALTTSLVEPPEAPTTGLLWIAVGLLAWGAGTVGRPRRRLEAS